MCCTPAFRYTLNLSNRLFRQSPPNLRLLLSLMSHRVLLLGAGKIGRMIARFLMDSGDYDLAVGDVNDAALKRIAKLTGADARRIDASNADELVAAMQGFQTVISAL